MNFRVSHYNFIWGAGAGLFVARVLTDRYWWLAAAAIAGGVVNYVWSLKQFKDGDPTVKDYLASVRKPKPKK